jgi:hypothetical protein
MAKILREADYASLTVKDSTIEIDVFIKAYENITDYRNIESLKTE